VIAKQPAHAMRPGERPLAQRRGLPARQHHGQPNAAADGEAHGGKLQRRDPGSQPRQQSKKRPENQRTAAGERGGGHGAASEQITFRWNHLNG
jgi:hypothetical protein